MAVLTQEEKEAKLWIHHSIGEEISDEPVKITAATSPEAALLLAILEDAIGVYRKYATTTTKEGSRLFLEAEEWIMEDEYDWLCSFNNICMILGYHAGQLRKDLIKEKEALQRGEIIYSKTRRTAVRPVIIE